jgi:hypothetical protein
MSVYTCYDMVADCKADKAAGWTHLVRQFVPPLRWMVTRYGGGEAELGLLLASLRPFPDEVPPTAEREFLVNVRSRAVEAAGWRGGESGTLELERFTAALAELTVLERQLVWFETMGYNSADAARLCRTAEDTAAKARARALEMLRSALDSWSHTIIADNAGSLARAARTALPDEPVPFRSYLDIIDGRMTWSNRVGVDRSVQASWFEVDHFCRVREADAAMRDSPPLDDVAAAPYFAMFGVAPPKPSLWKRMLASR